MSTATQPKMTDAERKAAKAQKERERRARIKAEKEQAAKVAAASTESKPEPTAVKPKPAKPEATKNGAVKFRAGGTPAEILEVLEASDEPLHVKEITKRVLARGKTNLKGKTPEATVAAVLSVDIRKNPESPFKKFDRGVFGLRG